MSERSFNERLKDLVHAYRKGEEEYKRREQSQKEEKKLQDAGLALARYEAGGKLADLGILDTMVKIERTMIALDGFPPEASLRLKLFGQIAPYGFTHFELFGLGDRAGVLFRNVSAGVRTREPNGKDDINWIRTRVPVFSLSAVCIYSAARVGLALAPGLYSYSTGNAVAEFKDPIHVGRKMKVPYIPLADWTRERFEELAWDIIVRRPDVQALRSQPPAH